MAAISIFPRMETTSTVAGLGGIWHNYTVPANKRWLFDYIELEFSVSNVGNTVDIEHPAGTSIWPQIGNFLKMNVDLASRYPRAVELEAGDVLRLAFVRVAASTVVSRVYVIERDI